jgi:hypothetical protein
MNCECESKRGTSGTSDQSMRVLRTTPPLVMTTTADHNLLSSPSRERFEECMVRTISRLSKTLAITPSRFTEVLGVCEGDLCMQGGVQGFEAPRESVRNCFQTACHL